jgi:hypothetical protein
MFATPDLPQCHRGEKRGAGRLVALVLVRALEPGPVEGLLVGVAGEQTEADRHAVVERDPGQPVGGRRRDVLEVRGPAPDDHAQGDHGVEPLRGERACDDGQLEGSRDTDDDR